MQRRVHGPGVACASNKNEVVLGLNRIERERDALVGLRVAAQRDARFTQRAVDFCSINHTHAPETLQLLRQPLRETLPVQCRP